MALALLPIGAAACSGYFLFRLRNKPWLPRPGAILSAPPEEAIYGAVWVLSVSVTVWVAFTAALSVYAYATRIPAAIRTAEWLTIPPVRRLARRFASFLLAAGAMSMTPAAGAIETPPVPIVVTVEQPDESPVSAVETQEKASNSAATPIPLRAGQGALDPAAETGSPETPSGAATPMPLRASQRFSGQMRHTVPYIVRPGDDMWSVTAGYLIHQENTPPSVARTTEVWREVVALNQNRIRSGDPDLIFPGETLLLPATGHGSRHRTEGGFQPARPLP